MKKSFLFFVIIGAIVLIAILTNPPVEKHREAVKKKLNANIQNTIKQSEGDDDYGLVDAALAFEEILGAKFALAMLDDVVSVDNYTLFSITIFDILGEKEVVGVGAFGNVYIFD
ncbi:MAG: hypothetical protein PHV76_04395 [Bacteroidales bacterium]|jgi:hypothetical protein|nr:hypothetical protein [Bacteroidales bacterium]MDD4702728.1 hypothetical protein [Bacteroidales bacterium]MDX9797819.1 hypothetical protein [Bacteroidales bacterium]